MIKHTRPITKSKKGSDQEHSMCEGGGNRIHKLRLLKYTGDQL